MLNNPTSKLIYVGDPMCSWCYGISEELSKVQEEFNHQLPMELVMGGLRPYNKETMLDLKSFLTGHWEEVNHRSGQKFNFKILDSDQITYDTEPPCRANVIVRILAPEKSMEFFKGTQRAFYWDNKNMHLATSYDELLKTLGIDQNKFHSLFESDEMKNEVKKDFERSSQLGVRGFPTLLLQQDDKITLIANGYDTAENMIRKIKSHLNQ